MVLAQIIANALFCSIFGLAGVNHLMHFEEEVPNLVAVGIPQELAPICFGIAIGLLILGTLLIMTMQFEVFGYICYTCFLFPVTWFMHCVPFITANANTSDPNAAQTTKFHMIQIMKNIALIGACFKFILNEVEKANKYVEEKKKKQQ